MKLVKLITLVTLIFHAQITFGQVSNVEGIKPLEGVVIPKVQPTKDIKPGTSFKDCSECPEMVVIPAGSFLMGSAEEEITGQGNEKPQHRVKVDSFAIGKYEITQAEWEAVMGTNLNYSKGRKLPVENVSWEDAQTFVKKLSQKSGKNYRLPSEAEWEYVARGGSTTVYPWGKDASELHNYAWFTQNAKLANPVGLKKSNQFGIYDMLGNVAEWTQDCWNSSYIGSLTDGSPWIGGDCSLRVVRGGSWSYAQQNVRTAYRYGSSPAKWGSYLVGFRVARSN